VFFNVKELELRKVRFDVSIPPGEIDYFDPGLRQSGPLDAAGEVELLSEALREIRIRGSLRVKIETECDRCLEIAVFPIESDFDLVYRPAPAKGEIPEEVEIHRGEVEIAFYRGSGLELNDILREQVLLSLPMQRVCREECQGICPVCGQDRNAAKCQCETRPADDRWAALRNL